MKRKCFMLFLSLFTLFVHAQNQEPAPQLEYVCELKVTCDPGYNVGPTAHGNRFIIPINGGTFEGPKMKGTVIPGGADHQLQGDKRIELEAIYSIKTDDGVYIHVRNLGLMCFKNGENYFRCAPKFEAPSNSKYDWLNNALFICVPAVKKDYISLKVWKVL